MLQDVSWFHVKSIWEHKKALKEEKRNIWIDIATCYALRTVSTYNASQIVDEQCFI